MLHFRGTVSSRAIVGSMRDEAESSPRTVLFKWLMVHGIGTFAMTLGLSSSGCGESVVEHPYNKEAAKASAKYRELHPEEFPPPKAQKGKVPKTRR